MKVLVIVGDDGEIDISFFANEQQARDALMRDLYENYQYLDLPEADDDATISWFIADNQLNYIWKIDDVIEAIQTT